MFAFLNKILPVLPLVTKIVDVLFPVAVGKRTAIAVAAKAGVAAARTFGVDIPPVVDEALDVAAASFAAAALGRIPAKE